MLSKFRIQTADIMIRIALHHFVVVYNLQLQHNRVLCYNTVTEMHIFLLEVDISRLASRSRVLKSVSRLTTIWYANKSVDNTLSD